VVRASGAAKGAGTAQARERTGAHASGNRSAAQVSPGAEHWRQGRAGSGGRRALVWARR
jgi:hypothetical protein